MTTMHSQVFLQTSIFLFTAYCAMTFASNPCPSLAPDVVAGRCNLATTTPRMCSYNVTSAAVFRSSLRKDCDSVHRKFLRTINQTAINYSDELAKEAEAIVDSMATRCSYAFDSDSIPSHYRRLSGYFENCSATCNISGVHTPVFANALEVVSSAKPNSLPGIVKLGKENIKAFGCGVTKVTWKCTFSAYDTPFVLCLYKT